MNEKQAKKYLEKKSKPTTKEEVDKVIKVMKEGKIYGDPLVVLNE